MNRTSFLVGVILAGWLLMLANRGVLIKWAKFLGVGGLAGNEEA